MRLDEHDLKVIDAALCQWGAEYGDEQETDEIRAKLKLNLRSLPGRREAMSQQTVGGKTYEEWVAILRPHLKDEAERYARAMFDEQSLGLHVHDPRFQPRKWRP